MGAAGLSAYGYPVNVVAETFPHSAMNALVQGSRRHLGMKVTPMEKVGPERHPGATSAARSSPS